MDIAGICETSWDDYTAEKAVQLARWDTRIQAERYVGGQYRTNESRGRVGTQGSLC